VVTVGRIGTVIVARSGVWGAGTTAGGVADAARVGCDKADGVGYRSSSTAGQAGDRWEGDNASSCIVGAAVGDDYRC
jgi:hypothetical protein